MFSHNVFQYLNVSLLQLSGFGNRLDTRVVDKIKSLAEDGVRNVSEVQRRCEELRDRIVPPDHDKSDRRFNPSRKDVYNHIYNSLSDTRYMKV